MDRPDPTPGARLEMPPLQADAGRVAAPRPDRSNGFRCPNPRGAALLLLITLAVATPLAGQSAEAGRPGPRAVMERDREIALAVSAAPATVSVDATVLVWTERTFEPARAGSNGVTCYVARSWPSSLEPHCMDAEASRTILPIHLRQHELWHAGTAPSAIDAEIAEGLRNGHYQLPTRPAMTYMMSAGQDLVDDNGSPVGRWRPHLMIYYPYLTSAALGLGPVPSLDAAVVVDPGTALANIMIPLDTFVEVRGWEEPGSMPR